MRKYFLCLILLLSLCFESYATTALDRDFYVRTGLQLDAIKRAVMGSDTNSVTYNTYVQVDSLNFGFTEFVSLQTPIDRHLDSFIVKVRHLSDRAPVFILLDTLMSSYGNVHFLSSSYGAFYDLVGHSKYYNLTDVPYPYKEILAVMGIDTQKEFELYFAAWYSLLWSGSLPLPAVPAFDYSLNSVSLWSHLDEIAVYTALCCAKFSSYHLYFPSMGDFGNE